MRCFNFLNNIDNKIMVLYVIVLRNEETTELDDV